MFVASFDRYLELIELVILTAPDFIIIYYLAIIEFG